MGADRLEFVFVTPEDRPLAIFGGAAERHRRRAARRRRHRVRRIGVHHRRARPPDRRPRRPPDRRRPRRQPAAARGTAASRASRPTPTGFVPVDPHGRVAGLERVYAAGDGTAFPIKQGGLATQQADAVAETIAAARRRADRAAAVPARPARDAPHRRRRPLHAQRHRRRRGRAARSRATRSGGRRARSPAATSPRSCSAATSSTAVERIRGDHLEVETVLSAGVPAAG